MTSHANAHDEAMPNGGPQGQGQVECASRLVTGRTVTPGRDGKTPAPICMTRSAALALCDAGYLPLAEYLRLVAADGFDLDSPQGGAVRLARVAHNHEVVGSNPTPATSSRGGLS